MKKVLITGFDPFGKEKINPSIEAVKKLPERIEDIEIIKMEIPTDKNKASEKLEKSIAKFRPDVVLNVGQAGGRSEITVERIGINIDDFSIEDNGKNQPIDEKIIIDGPDAYFTSIPIKDIVENLRKNKIPAKVSNTAGTFVCNHVCYFVSHLKNTKYPEMKTGFVHIPFIPEQVIDKPNMPSMSIDMLVKALELIIIQA